MCGRGPGRASIRTTDGRNRSIVPTVRLKRIRDSLKMYAIRRLVFFMRARAPRTRSSVASSTAHVVADVDARADALDARPRAFQVDGTRERGAMSFRPGSKASERKKGFKKAIDADEARRKREGACDAIDARDSSDVRDGAVARVCERVVRGA